MVFALTRRVLYRLAMDLRDAKQARYLPKDFIQFLINFGGFCGAILYIFSLCWVMCTLIGVLGLLAHLEVFLAPFVRLALQSTHSFSQDHFVLS